MLAQHPVHQAVREVLAAQVALSGGGQDLECPLEDLHDRDVEGPSAEIEHAQALVRLTAVEAVGQRGRGGLVQDAPHLEPGHLRRASRRLALVLVEVGRDRHDGIGDGVAEVRLGVSLERLEDHTRERHGPEGLSPELELPLRSHPALEDGRAAVGPLVAQLPCRGPDDQLTVVEYPHDRRREDLAVGVRDQLGSAGAEHRAQRVGRSQVDSDGRFGVGHGQREGLVRTRAGEGHTPRTHLSSTRPGTPSFRRRGVVLSGKACVTTKTSFVQTGGAGPPPLRRGENPS